MSQIQFHETRAGAEFYRRTMPELVKQLTRIADALERVVERGEPEAASEQGRGDSQAQK
jgi:hypothetical protein